MDRSGSFLPQYISTRTVSYFLATSLLITAALFSVSAGFEISEVNMLLGVASDGSISAADRYTHSVLRKGLAGSRGIAIGLTAVLFIVWLHRSRINGRAFGARRFEFSRKWTLLGFVVPALNLFRPLQVVSEVWRASDPRATQNPFDWKLVEIPRLLPVWWWVLLASMAVQFFGMTLAQSIGVGLNQLTISRGITATADIGASVAAVLGYLIVTGITTAQDQKWAVLNRGHALPAAIRSDNAIRDAVTAAQY